MIITFHYFTNFLYSLIKKYVNKRNSPRNNFTITKLNSDLHPLAQRDAENDIKFDPPVFKQRYERVSEVLLDEKWKNRISKVVDFGCAEFGLFVFLKNTIRMKEMLFVDVDECIIREYMYRVYPLTADHLSRRAQELTVRVFRGSAADPDSNLLNTDVVIAIELIEHLYPDILEALPYNVFSYIRPKLAIFTTPNAEFNVLFGKVQQFRHADHKFEWTREQFESWATNLTQRFPNYTVQFDGVGLGPSGTEELGCCSQLAVFVRKDVICDNYVEEVDVCGCTNSNCASLDFSSCIKCCCSCSLCVPICSFGVCTYNSLSKNALTYRNDQHYYELIVKIDYPFEIDTRTEEEKILDELRYRMHLLGRLNGQYYNFEKNRSEIPLNRLVYNTVETFPTESEVRNLLLKFQYQLEKCPDQETKQLKTCVIYEPEMDISGSSSDVDGPSGYESDKRASDESAVSDWDEKDAIPSWNKEQTTKDSGVVVKSDSPKRQMRLEVTTTKKQQGPLFDSGYQKSPSAPDDSPQPITPIERPNKLSNILSVFDNFDKVNELDAVRKEKKFFNFSSNLPHRDVMRKLCQEIVKHPIAGPSRDSKRKQAKKSQSSDSEESVEDVKSITTCILENSLNRIELEDEEVRGDLIQELLPEVPQPLEEAPGPALIVENGDLANNNRDLEGNNYPAEDGGDPQPENDNDIDNLEVNNVNIDNNNEIVEEVPQPPVVEVVEEVADENVRLEPLVDVEVAWSSREALFDVNSHVDLLEDFDMDAAAAAPAADNYVNGSDNAANQLAVLPHEENGFPNWLLQIFEEEEPGDAEDDMHDEPHFYCQGDGLGVHPSTVALNDDDDDDDDNDDDDGNESGTDSSSRSGSVSFANADSANSAQEMLMPPEEPSTDDNLVVLGHSVSTSNQNVSITSSEHEVFASAESESNVMASSCSH